MNAPSRAENPGALKSDRIEAALVAALGGGPRGVLFDLLDRASGMPGPKPRTEVLRAFGARIAAEGKGGEPLVGELLASKKVSLFYVGVMALAERASEKGGGRALAALVELADETVKERRDAVVEGTSIALVGLGDQGAATVRELADGFLHAFVALEALTSPRVLERLSSSASVLDVLSDAFERADEAPRSADRSQGLRVLRQGLPEQIARAIVRFSDTLGWLEERLDRSRPETRAVVSATIGRLRKVLGEAEADRLRRAHEGSAKPPRDPSRIVKGTRKRSKGRG